MKAGDFILTHGTAFYSRAIEREQRRRYPKNPELTHWTHAALVVSDDGGLLQALGNGIVTGHVSDYSDYRTFSVDAVASTKSDRDRVLRFAWSQAGLKYDWVDIASIEMALVTRIKVTFETEGHYICSGFVARCLERTDAIFPRTAQHMMPADLAAYFGGCPSCGK